MDWIDALGVMAGFLSTVAFLPQALKVWKTKSTKAISIWMYILYCFSLFLWGLYAYLIRSYPLLVTELVTGVMVFYILVMKIKSLKD